ncbi:hypothetical protein [Halodesulfovibrio marinisediminis]|uniref:Uncharacterized protein n=1 Tax=Halodesulfovibrio marinisediminis DSM 17456 TaxID=1121457 RepID=A0A1N6DP89_9BACT|nr:hypothetical protein [Halodesulfovibrio marinisediminis]SIN72566.1 hypothetical protein SAMN02745161_0361 [Halodesulfovibrio marinisediminis DSM 17456]
MAEDKKSKYQELVDRAVRASRAEGFDKAAYETDAIPYVHGAAQGGLMSGSSSERKRIRVLEDEIADLKSSLQSQQQIIESLKKSTTQFQDKIETQYKKLRDDQASFVEDTFGNLDQRLESWYGKMAYLSDAFDGLQKKEKKLFDFYNKFMGTSDVNQKEISLEEYQKLSPEEQATCFIDEEDRVYCLEGERTIGRFEEIESVMSEIELERFKYQERYEKLYQEIAELRGGATNEGLGKAYAEAEKKHFYSNIVWNILLLFSVASLAAVPLAWDHYFSFPAWVQQYAPYGRIMFFASFELPMMFVVFIASKNSNLYRRLAEEYRYKKTLAFTYNGLQSEIGKIKNPEKASALAEKLLEQSLAASGANPSALVNEAKSDLPMMKLLELAEKYGEGVVEITKGLRGSKVSIQPRDVKSSQNDKAVEEDKKEAVDNKVAA